MKNTNLKSKVLKGTLSILTHSILSLRPGKSSEMATPTKLLILILKPLTSSPFPITLKDKLPSVLQSSPLSELSANMAKEAASLLSLTASETKESLIKLNLGTKATNFSK